MFRPEHPCPCGVIGWCWADAVMVLATADSEKETEGGETCRHNVSHRAAVN